MGFVYENDAHLEPKHSERLTTPGATDGVFGRHVANSEFFEAWLAFGHWQRLLAVVANQASGESLKSRFDSRPRVAGIEQQLEIVPLQRFHDSFFPSPPATTLHLPQPVNAELAWVRHHKGAHSFALSGVTHTISLKDIMQCLRELVTAPFEPYDTLFCISRAALDVVRRVTDNYAEFLRERFGGSARLRMRLEVQSFGVDPEKFRPAMNDERLAARTLLGIAPEAVCVLYVGRLSYASKVHPFPMYRAVAEAARRSGCRVHLIVAGWAEAPSILQKFQQGAQALGQGITVTFVDGMHPRARVEIWRAADVFTSLSDNIQETLGLTILEAQASGLPVVTSDWDGCRESVAADETGYVVPTRMVSGATMDSTSRHLMSETSYGAFLGETNQTVSVDMPLLIQAFERLFTDPALRARMAQRARARVLEHYTWPHIIHQYETVWRAQELVRCEHQATASRTGASGVRTPVAFPDVEYAFGSYPSEILGMGAQVVAANDATSQLELLLKLPLTNYLATSRVADANVLSKLLETCATPCELGKLETMLSAHGSSHHRARATLAWMLKYDLLRLG